jgi:hypothetical protein
MLVLVAMLLASCGAAVPTFNSAPQAQPMEESAFAGEAAVAQDGDGVAGDVTSAMLNRRLIARATLDIVVQETDAAVAAIQEIITEQGGFVSNSNFYGDATLPSEHYGSMTLRVPAENLDATLDAMAALALRVRTRSINREDITDQYTDTEAQLRTLQATEEELFAMLEEVRERPDATPDDILAVHTRLMEVRGQIEQVQGRKNMYDNLVALSTIDVSVMPDSSNAPVVEEGWRPGAVLRDASRALVNTIRYLGDFLIWLVVYALPVLLLIALPFLLLFFVGRWFVRRGRRNKAPTAPPAGESSTPPQA